MINSYTGHRRGHGRGTLIFNWGRFSQWRWGQRGGGNFIGIIGRGVVG